MRFYCAICGGKLQRDQKWCEHCRQPTLPEAYDPAAGIGLLIGVVGLIVLGIVAVVRGFFGG